MKRLFVILASCCLMVSCQWWHETFDSPEECVSWYLEQLRSAADSRDYDSMEELTDDLFDYCDDLEDSRDWESVSVLIKEFEEKNGNIEDLLYTRGEKGLVSESKLDNDRVNHERDDSPKQCVVWYMDQIYKANEKGDSQLVEDLADRLFSYQMRLSRYDLDAVMEVIYQYENRYGRIDAIYYAYDVCEATECCEASCEDDCVAEDCCAVE